MLQFGAPEISIITACFRSAKVLERAFSSLDAQTFRNFEHIVIDGGSQDGTLDIIRRREDRIAYWVSEKDGGIADAWNKGIVHAKGAIIGLLNADDQYTPEVLAAAYKALKGRTRSIAFGDVSMRSPETGNEIQFYRGRYDPRRLESGFQFVHTSCFVTADVYREIGGFNSQYRIAIDTDFLLRCVNAGIDFVRADILTLMQDGGMSQKRHAEAFMEYLQQLWVHGYPKAKICRGALRYLLHHWKAKIARRVRTTLA